jgi:hypothetical protein
MDYKNLEMLVSKHNKYVGLRNKLMDEDYQDAILLEDGLSIDTEDRLLFINSIKECYTKVIINLEQEIDEVYKSTRP